MFQKKTSKLTVRGIKATEYIGNLIALHIKVACEIFSSFSSLVALCCCTLHMKKPLRLECHCLTSFHPKSITLPDLPVHWKQQIDLCLTCDGSEQVLKIKFLPNRIMSRSEKIQLLIRD